MNLTKIEKVSIIVPVYNVEAYLEKCIKSIINQTYTKWELILINDGSCDASGKICDKYKQIDDRIIVVHQSNKGQAAARNVGVKMASTEWILFVDSDDIIHTQMLEFLVRAIEESGANMSVCGRVKGLELPKDFQQKREFKYKSMNVDEENLCEWFSSVDHYLSNIYWLIYPKLVSKNIIMKYLFCEGRIFEDNEVSCKWLVYSKNIAILSENMYFYMINPTGTMQSQFSKKKLDYLWALEQQVEFYYAIGYEKIMGKVAHEYFNTVVWMCKCVKEQLKDEKIIKKVMLHAENLYKKWNRRGMVEVEEITLTHIIKYAHPIRYRIKKYLKNALNKLLK